MKADKNCHKTESPAYASLCSRSETMKSIPLTNTMRTLSLRSVSHAICGETLENRLKCKIEQMRGGKIVILFFLAPDESVSSQSIGMLNTRHKKP